MRKCRWGKIAVSTMLLVMNLTACGKTNNEVLETNATEAVEVQEESTVSVENELMMAETVNVEEETTEEESIESVVYEGIDMESTLPWREWIKTLDDIITEPKFVIVNDTTNKKIILENGQKITFESTDILVLYYPRDREIYSGMLEKKRGGAFVEPFLDNTMDENLRWYFDLSGSIQKEDEIDIEVENEVDGENIKTYATLIIK